MQIKYTEIELTKLLADVEKEFTSHLAKAEENFRLAKSENESAAPSVDGTETLAKAEDEKPAEAKDKKEDKEEAKPEASAPKKAPADSKEDAVAESEGEEEGQEEQAAADEVAAEAPAAEGDASGYDAEDLQHLAEMYASMSSAELMAHHDAVKEALDAMAAKDAPPAAADVAVPAASAPAQAAQGEIDKCGDMSMGKSENINVDLVKSENLALAAKNEELKKSLDAVSEFITKLVSKKAAPAGKAITSLETIAKSEIQADAKAFSKSEITAILNKKAADQKLSKSDREAINAYYGAGQVGLEKINHLLK